MNVELIITKDRVPYIVEQLGADRVTVSEYSKEQDRVKFELNSQIDILHMFHAGVRCGMNQMKTVFEY